MTRIHSSTNCEVFWVFKEVEQFRTSVSELEKKKMWLGQLILVFLNGNKTSNCQCTQLIGLYFWINFCLEVTADCVTDTLVLEKRLFILMWWEEGGRMTVFLGSLSRQRQNSLVRLGMCSLRSCHGPINVLSCDFVLLLRNGENPCHSACLWLKCSICNRLLRA